MTIQSGNGTKWWFNGLPFTTVAPTSGITLGTQKYWFNGLPLSPYSTNAQDPIQPNPFIDTDVFFTPFVNTQSVAPSLVVDTDIFFAPLVSYTTIALWTPAALGTDVWSWWKFDAIADANGATITSVSDTSSNSRALTMTGTPTAHAAGQNGLKTGNFSVGSSYGTFAGLGALSAATFFAVNKSGASPTDTTFGALIDTGTDTQFNHYTYGGTVYCDWFSNARKTAGAVTVNVWHQVLFWSATNDWGHAMDGTDKFTTTSNTTAALSTSYLASDANNSWRFQGEIGEVVILQNKPTTGNRQNVEGYLAWKWGLVSSLPSGHPYKAAPPTVTGGTVFNQNISPPLYADPDTFYAPTIPALGPTPGLVIDADVFYPANFATLATLAPSLYADADVLFTSAVSAGTITLAPLFYVDTDTIYVPMVTTGVVTLAPSLVTDASVFYVPTVTQSSAAVLPPLYNDTDVFYVPALIPGQVSISPSRVVDVDTIYPTSTLPKDIIAPLLFVDTDNFFVPIFQTSYTLQPGFVSDDVTIYPASISSRQQLFPALVPDDTVIYAVSVREFDNVSPSLVSDVDTFLVPRFIPGPVAMLPSRVVDTDVFYTAIMGNLLNTPIPTGGTSTSIAGNVKYVSTYTMPQAGLILKLDLRCNSNDHNGNSRALIYDATAAGGLPGNLLAVSFDINGLTKNTITYKLKTPVSALANQNIWVGIQTDGTESWYTNVLANGSKFNTDAYADGPTNPFGVTSNDNKQLQITLYYLAATSTSAPSPVNPSLLVDADVIYAPAISGSKTILPSLLVDTDFFYAPFSIIQVSFVIPGIFVDTDTIYAPVASISDYVLHPPFVVDSDVAYSPDIVGFAIVISNVFSAVVPSDDVIYPATVIADQKLLPSLVVDTDVISRPSVAVFSPTISSAPIPSDDVIYPVTVVLAIAFVAPSRVIDVDQFYGANVGQVATPVSNVFSAVVPSDDVIYPATVTEFGANLPAPFVVDVDMFYPPSIQSVDILSPSTVLSNDFIFAPTIGAGTVTLLPPLVDSGLDYYNASFAQFLGTFVVLPPPMNSDDLFYPPRNYGVSNKGWRRQINILGEDDKEIDVVGLTTTVVPEMVE